MANVVISILAPSGVMQMAIPAITQPFPDELAQAFDFQAPASLGAVVSAGVYVLASTPAVLADHFLYDYYYRIWIVPSVIEAQNPQYNVGIPFHIWNAYPQPTTNTLQAVNLIDAEGLEFTLDPPEVFKALEYREVEVSITPAAGIGVDGSIVFDFLYGQGTLFFKADIAEFVQMVPDPPVTEEWEWLTDILTTWNANEQRIGLRSSPRRSIQYALMIEDDEERRRQYNRLYKSLANRIVLPFYQYAAELEADAPTGSTELLFDPVITDMRPGDFALVLNKSTEEAFLVKIETVTATGATLDSPTTFTARRGMIISPTFTCRLRNRSSLGMQPKIGELKIQAQALGVRPLFSRPGSTAIVQTLDGMPILEHRPLADGDVEEVFDVNYEVLDGDTGVQDIRSSWPHPFVSGGRQFLVHRRDDPTTLDWWRDFLVAVNGRQNPFLVPTFREDLVLAEDPAPLGNTFKVVSSDYRALYFPYETYRRLRIVTEAGVIYRRVLSAVDNGDGTTSLELDDEFGATAEEATITLISFLNVTRLSSDRVVLRHDHRDTLIELGLRTIDA